MIRNRYNQVPHLTQDTNGKVTNSQQTPQTRAKRSVLSQQVNFVLINSVYMRKISSNSFIILGSKHFCIWQWSFVFVSVAYLAINSQIFNFERLRGILPRRIVQSLSQTSTKTNVLVITSQPKRAFLSQEGVGGIDGIERSRKHAKRHTSSSGKSSWFHLVHAVLWPMSHTQKDDIPKQPFQVLK